LFVIDVGIGGGILTRIMLFKLVNKLPLYVL